MEEQVSGMLSAHEARVLGCLMEKQMTTPDYYPLTLKALTAACNQKSSRVPVLSLSESEVAGVVNGLRSEGLVTARMDGRADRYEHHLSRKLGLTSKERAVLCVLMLRSALTLNEIRINTARMVSFDAAEELQSLLDTMMEREQPLLLRIPRAAGQREDRFAHLLCGEPEYEAVKSHGTSSNITASERIARLEGEVADLKHVVQQLCALTGLDSDAVERQ
ncbi:MAG: YceH family protein [Mariprofundus sp.]